jgi:hypothetical protein
MVVLAVEQLEDPQVLFPAVLEYPAKETPEDLMLAVVAVEEEENPLQDQMQALVIQEMEDWDILGIMERHILQAVEVDTPMVIKQEHPDQTIQEMAQTVVPAS